jgi:formimidoylglutamate deiminase
MPQLYRPELVFSEGEFQSQGDVLVGDDGIILAVAKPEEAQDYEEIQLPRKAILPGFVNAHSHTFQRLIRGRSEHRGTNGEDFWTWRDAMYRAALAVEPEDVYDVARMTFLEMVRAGTTTAGEFHYLHRDRNGAAYKDPNLLAKRIIAAAESVGMRIALLRVAYARAGFELPAHPGQARFNESAEEYLDHTAALAMELRENPDQAWLGVAPHSIRALPLAQIEQVVRWAGERNLPIHMHVAEQPAELAACQKEYGMTPVQLLARRELLSPSFTLVHAIHITDAEMEALATTRALICSCPTTERNLGDGIIAADRAAALGIRFALGSDSQAQIDPLEDARELEYHLRLRDKKRVILDDIQGVDLAARLFAYATLGGAESLGSKSGVLAPGRPADFFTVDLDDPSIAGAAPKDLLPILVFSLSRTAIRDVVVGGKLILRDGVHPAQAEIVDRYKQVYRKVWLS